MNTPTPKSDQEVAEDAATEWQRNSVIHSETMSVSEIRAVQEEVKEAVLSAITKAKAGMVEELAELRQKLEGYTSKAILTMEGTLVCSPQVGMAFNDLRDERDQLRAQIHDLCHDKHVAGPVTEQEFCDGCEAFQKKLFGSSIITQLKAQLAEVTKAFQLIVTSATENWQEHDTPEDVAKRIVDSIEFTRDRLSLSEAAASEMRRWIETPTFGELGKISDERQVEKAKILSSLAGTSYVPRSELEKANELLRELEWVNIFGALQCPMCGRTKHGGGEHDPDCKLSSHLNGKDGR